METNFTYTNSTNDRKVLTYLALPNNNTYSFTGGLKHSEKYDQLQHLIIFSRPQDTPCYTISDVSIIQVFIFVSIEVGTTFSPIFYVRNTIISFPEDFLLDFIIHIEYLVKIFS